MLQVPPCDEELQIIFLGGKAVYERANHATVLISTCNI